MLTNEQIGIFHEIGYLKVGRVLADEELAALRTSFDLVLRKKAKGKPELLRNLASSDPYADDPDADQPSAGTRNVVVQVVNIWEAEDSFRAHLYHPTITTMAAELIGAHTLRVWHDQLQYKPPRVGGITGWHQDYPAWPILEPADLVSAWVALEDALIDNGCMWMVPGSHKWGIHKGMGTDEGDGFVPTYDSAQLPPGADVKMEPVEVRAGECAFHHCLTWHGSPRNPTDRKRPAIAVHYMPGYTRFVPKGTHVMDARVEVQPGEVLKGDYFPTVYDNGPLRWDESVLTTVR